MPKLFIATLLFLFSINSCLAQDIIIKRSTDEIPAKVIEVTSTEIKYKRLDNIDGPTFIIPKSEVFMIRYSNGTNDIFYAENPETETVSKSPAVQESKTEYYIPPNSTGSELYNHGLSDASRYYKGYKTAGTVTLLVGLISPIVGLIPAVASSATTPDAKHLNYPNQELMNKFEYYDGYTKRSKRIKQGKVWSNLGIAFGVNVVAFIVLYTGN